MSCPHSHLPCSCHCPLLVQQVSVYLITLIVSETHFKKIGLLAPSRRQGNIQLNLVHPPRRHPPVPENKVSGNKLSIGHLVAKKAG